MFSCSTTFLVVIVYYLNADLVGPVHRNRGSTFSKIHILKHGLPMKEMGIQLDPISNKRIPGSSWNDRMVVDSIASLERDRLKIRSFPVGQGDAQVIECPDGLLTVVDLGTMDGRNQGFWHTNELRRYFNGKYEKIGNIVITHNHEDHYNLFPHVLRGSDRLMSLRRIYITKTEAELPDVLKKWINEIGGSNKIRVFNGGEQCGFKNGTCGVLDLCPNNWNIVANVLSVNAGRQCRQQQAGKGRKVSSGYAGRKSRKPVEQKVGKVRKVNYKSDRILSVNSGERSGNPVGPRTRYVDYENTNSIVFSISYNRVKVHMNGDFEDCSTSEAGAQRQMVEHYGRELETTVYKLAHHGASNLANKNMMRDAVKPKAIFVSGNPYFRYHHPRCEIIKAFNRTLCDPTRGGLNLFPDSTVQEIYTCGCDGGHKTVTGNRLAVYTTVPNNTHMNEIEFVTDGTRWGFINHYHSRRASSFEPAITSWQSSHC